jgi:signal peptidase I
MTATSKVASTSALAALVLATVWLFWPSALGGATTYVTTYGVSMQPDFSTGDLAILSPADSYSVGDVVAYHSESLNTVVMHRIVSADANGFVTQGDNNDWLDEGHLTEEDILGSLFIRIPQGGTALEALRSPGVFLPLVGVVVAVLGAVRKPPGRHHLRALRRRLPGLALPSRARASMPTRARAAALLPPARTASMPIRARARQVALGAAAVTLLAAAGCGVLLAVPPTQTDTRTLQVTEQGRFSYAGKAVPGTTYPSGRIATGDTVWTALVSDLTVSFTNTVTGDGLADVTGTLQLDVVVSAPDGWSAVLTSGPAAALEDGTATASVALDADAAAELLDRHYAEIGSAGGSATLTVTPAAATSGTVEGHSFTGGSLSGLAFTLDEMSLRPVSTEPADLAPSVPTSVEVDEVVPRTLQVLALSVSIGLARTVAGAVLLLALMTLLAGTWIGRIGRGDVADQFLVRHADRILPVASFSPGPTVIDVSDAESLHRVAERFDTVVLHHAGEDEDVFAVRDVDATYRFVVPGMPGRRGMPPVPAPARAPAPADATGPLLSAPIGGLWGSRFA